MTAFSTPTPSRGRRRRRRALVRIAVAIAAIGLVAPQLATAQEADLDDQRADTEASLDDTEASLDVTTAALSELVAEISLVEERLADAESRLALLEDEVARLEAEERDLIRRILDLNEVVASARSRITSRARSLYMHGTTNSPLLAMMEATTSQDALDRAAWAGRLSDSDRATAEQAIASRLTYESLSDELEGKQAVISQRRTEADAVRTEVAAELDTASGLRDELATRQDTLEGEQAELQSEIDRIDRAIEAREAARLERERREAEARAAEAAAAAANAEAAQEEAATTPTTPVADEPDPPPPPPPSPGRVCPMSPASIVSYWGDPRGGGSRYHEGNDIAGSYRQTVYAIVSGTWDVQSYGNNAGNWAILKGDDGISYWYLHLDSHAVSDGSRVAKGQHVAYNGWTGNARGTVYHIHFEVHPGGGGPVDPYPYISGIC